MAVVAGFSAFVPLRAGAAKSRLAGLLDEDERRALVDAMLAHVLDVLAACPQVGRIFVVTEAARALPAGMERLDDEGGGLNPALHAAVARSGARDILIVHADLPLLTSGEVTDLLTAAHETGCALAPDREGQGTNALALCGRPPQGPDGFRFQFGAGSCAAHRIEAQRCGLAPAIIERPGLALDIDYPHDLRDARAAGWPA